MKDGSTVYKLNHVNGNLIEFYLSKYYLEANA